jgi:hypothetical protein
MTISEDDVRSAIAGAEYNWKRWFVEFNFRGDLRSHPILLDEKRFAEFTMVYHVQRTIRRGHRAGFQQLLREKLPAAALDPSGAELDRLERALRPEFGVADGRRSLVSVVSKTAAFLQPETILAWDSFAKKGLMNILGRGEFRSYSDYLMSANRIWSHEFCPVLSRVILAGYHGSTVDLPLRYQRRVFDWFLMKHGGRSF